MFIHKLKITRTNIIRIHQKQNNHLKSLLLIHIVLVYRSYKAPTEDVGNWTLLLFLFEMAAEKSVYFPTHILATKRLFQF